jgi:hypothetical protein
MNLLIKTTLCYLVGLHVYIIIINLSSSETNVMFLVADMKERVHLDDLDVDWRIILKLIFSIGERTGLIWVTIGTCGDRIIDFQFHNLRSGVAAHPAKSCNG